MQAENGALSLDSAVELLRTPEPEQAEQEEAKEADAVEQPQEADPTPETEAEGEAVEAAPEAEVDAVDEEPEIPAVDPPAFYTKAEKEAFAALPPEQQQTIARLARDGEKHVAKIQQDIATERKALADAKAAIEQERAQYQEALLSNFPQPPDPSLIETNPVEYLKQDAAYKHAVQNYQMAEYLRQKQAEQQQAEERAQEAERVEREAEKLKELIPEIADPVNGEKVAQELISYAKGNGFGEDVLSQADAIELHILHKAMKWDAAQKAAKAAKAKPVPKVSAPGVGRTRAELSADERKAGLARLERTGSIEDAVRLLRT
jgi:hypothetical protein